MFSFYDFQNDGMCWESAENISPYDNSEQFFVWIERANIIMKPMRVIKHKIFLHFLLFEEGPALNGISNF